MLQLLRVNIGLSIVLSLLLLGMLLFIVFGFMMSRAGASLRPIYWFAGFFALIILPLVIGNSYKALQTAKTEAPRTAALNQIASSHNQNSTTHSLAAHSLFGADVDPQLISDVRNIYDGIFRDANFAQFAVLPNGESVLIARFNHSMAAEQAWVNYLRFAGLQVGGVGDSQRGYVVTRPVGDRLYALPFGTMLGIWTGANDAVIRKRMLAGGFEIPSNAPIIENLVPDQNTDKRAHAPPISLITICFLAYLFVVILYYFKGASWAGTHPAKTGTSPLTSRELVKRLESINALDVPFQIVRGKQLNEFFATWRYADAKWIDLARTHGMRRTMRIRMIVDETSHKVCATDYVTRFDWSAGADGANLEWKAMLGIFFFQYEHERVFGLQLDEHGRFKPNLSYSYTFNLQEMKSPLIEAVTQAGWDWRPTVWQAPTWLHWLTN